jgi:hypothetical protein
MVQCILAAAELQDPEFVAEQVIEKVTVVIGIFDDRNSTHSQYRTMYSHESRASVVNWTTNDLYSYEA